MVKPINVEQVKTLASSAVFELDGKNGDPSKRASWIRERQLAALVLELLARMETIRHTTLDDLVVPL